MSWSLISLAVPEQGEGGVIPVRWLTWRNAGSYNQTAMTTGVWRRLFYSSSLPTPESGNQGTHYGDGIMGNDSGRTITGDLIADANVITSGTGNSFDFGLGMWNGASYDQPLEATAINVSVPAAGSSLVNGRRRWIWNNVTLANGDRFSIWARRLGGSANIRVAGLSLTFQEYGV